MRFGALCLDPITQKCTRSIIFLLASSILNIETITGLYSAQFLVKRYRNRGGVVWLKKKIASDRHHLVFIQTLLCRSLTVFILFQDLQPRVDGRVRVRGLEIIPGVACQMCLICTKTAASSQVGKTLYLKKL